MNVRCKMICTNKNNSASAWDPSAKPTCSVKLEAARDDANKTWAKYTPSGYIELQINNPDAYDAFELGKFYFVDFRLAPAEEKSE